MTRKWKKVSSKLMYKSPWIKIHEDKVIRPDGSEGIYGYLEKDPGNIIIAMDNDNSIYFVYEFRYPLNKNILNLPAGVIDSEDILQEAKKELFEETRISAKRWRRLGGFYVGPGHETTQINVFLATDLDISELKTSGQEGDEAILEITKVKISKVKDMVTEGEIECGMTMAALNLFFLDDSIK